MPLIYAFIRIDITYGRNILKGVGAYCRSHPGVELQLISTREESIHVKPDCDGILIHDFNPPEEFFSTVPSVKVGGDSGSRTTSSVYVDNDAIGRRAARHLTDNGYKYFTFFCSSFRARYSVIRKEGIKKEVERVGGTFFEQPFLLPELYSDGGKLKECMDWIHSLPKPLAFIGASDKVSLGFLQLCYREGIAVPQEIAVVGVDNDDLRCELSIPPMSSVQQPLLELGCKAVEMLNDLIQGKARDSIILQPGRVIERGSSNFVVVDDPHVRKALELIADFSVKGWKAEQVCNRIPLCRRALEKRFRKHTGSSILEMITKQRISRARDLLERTTLPLDDVAEASGYANLFHFSTRFKKETGFSPAKYRKQFFCP